MNRRFSNRADRRRPPRRSRGVALIAVLWVVLLLSIIAGSLLLLTRSDLRLSRNLILSSRAEALAEGGVDLAVLGLLDQNPDTRWVADGRPYRVETEFGILYVSVQDETGLIDLNAAPPDLLSGVFVSVGVDADQAVTLADRIADWRDEDDDPHPSGAEQADYDAAGLDVRVGNTDFLTPDEIQRIPGVTSELYALVAPALTVYSRRPGVNPASAPKLVLMALPGVDDAVADAILAAREEATANGAPAAVAGASFGAAAALLPGESRRFLTGGVSNLFSVRSRATLGEGATYVQEAVVELQPGANPPWRIHAWRPGESYPTEAATSESE